MITPLNIVQHARNGNVISDYPDVDNHRVRVLNRDVELLIAGKKVLVKTGFKWDEASVPFWLLWAFPKSGKYAYAALPHDVAYYSKFCTRYEADKEYLNYSLAFSHPFSAWCRFAGVRLFGWLYWNRKRSKMALENETKIIVL
ncbi:DUF1353 domain-containing protein [Polluticaenibacter yanchengensis]|uniref:DUF1353 domain-containing protein n=1 Tax=Polluticaenibacter yanchengensis TaxID=3014562 RepID=A0ABT4UIP1_9BACT|nr:DUF1353 domain-containing protein [Chitinophagaceae bacterium LY-5]